jgi:hypothetical protein
MYPKNIHPNVNISNDFWVLITHHPPENEVAYNVIFISKCKRIQFLNPLPHQIFITPPSSTTTSSTTTSTTNVDPPVTLQPWFLVLLPPQPLQMMMMMTL